MCNVKLRCDICGQLYKECDNVGAWECQGMYVWSDTLGIRVQVPADHGTRWTADSVAEIPSYAMHHLNGVRPEAVVNEQQTVQQRQPGRTAVTVYENVRIRRVDAELYNRTQRKFWFVPSVFTGRTELGFHGQR